MALFILLDKSIIFQSHAVKLSLTTGDTHTKMLTKLCTL